MALQKSDVKSWNELEQQRQHEEGEAMAALRLMRSSLLSLNEALAKAETAIGGRRWRKRRWAPIAASKLFVVRERTPIDPEEYEELKVRYAHYRTAVRSIREYFKNEHLAETSALTDQSHVEQEEKHLAQCLSENERWNRESAKFRQAREVIFEKETQDLELKQLIEIEEQQKALHEELRLQVLKTKDESRKFVSPENLENMIEVTLNQRSTYNFAIDTEGNRFIEQADGSTVFQKSGNEDDDEISQGKTVQNKE